VPSTKEGPLAELNVFKRTSKTRTNEGAPARIVGPSSIAVRYVASGALRRLTAGASFGLACLRDDA
jgi:hypothetical protein